MSQLFAHYHANFILQFNTYLAWIIYTFYRHRRELNEYLGSSNEGISQSHFLRMLVLGCFDMFITLPTQVIALVISAMDSAPFRFYNGWAYIHSDWGPNLQPKSLWSTGKWTVFIVHWDEWLYPFFALVFFALFGLTPEARKGYRRFFRMLCRPFGAKHVVITDEVLSEVVFKSGKGADASYTSNSFSVTV